MKKSQAKLSPKNAGTLPGEGAAGAFDTREELRDASDQLLLTTFDDDEEVFGALRAGAAGYLLKDAPSEKLAEAIRAAARGESFLQPSIAAKVVAEFSRLARTPPAAAVKLAMSPEERQALSARFNSAAGRQMLQQTAAQHLKQDVRCRAATAPVIAELMTTLSSLSKP